jgi:hypothetical protein
VLLTPCVATPSVWQLQRQIDALAGAGEGYALQHQPPPPYAGALGGYAQPLQQPPGYPPPIQTQQPQHQLPLQYAGVQGGYAPPGGYVPPPAMNPGYHPS